MLVMLAMPFNVAKSEYDPLFTALRAFKEIFPTTMTPISEKKGNKLASLPEDPLERFIAIATFMHITRLAAARHGGIESVAGPVVDITELPENVKKWFQVPYYLEKDVEPFVDAHYKLFRKILAKIPNARELIVRILEHEDYEAAHELAEKIRQLADDPEIKYSQERYIIFKTARKLGVKQRWVTEPLSELEEYFRKKENEELVRKAVMDVMLSVGEKERPIVPKVESWEGLKSLLEAYEKALEEVGYHSTCLLVSALRSILENRGTLSNEDLGCLAEGAGAIREVYEFVQRNPWFLEGILGGGDVEKYSAHLKRRVAYLEVPDEFRGVAENLARSFVERAAKEGAGAHDKREVLNRLLRSANAQASFWAKVESVLRRHAGEERIEPHRIAESLAELVPGAWNRAIERKIVIR